jgi:hypothetical protein
MVTLSSHYHIPGPRVIHQHIDGEAVIIDFASGSYYSASGSGAAVWNLLAAGLSVADLVATLTARFTGDGAIIADAVTAYLEQLAAEGLIEAGAALPGMAEALPDLPAARPAFAPPTLQKYTDMEDLILLDPIHEVDDTGWPAPKGVTDAAAD